MPQKSAELTGVLVPITTPFDAQSGDIDAVPLRNNVRAFLKAGATGVLVGGSTGEAAMLTEEEWRQSVSWVRDITDGAHLMVGAGRESTRATIAACQVGADEGADTALVRAPAYYGSGLSPEALVEHFRAVADASPVPILVYNIPKYTHVSIGESVISALTGHNNIIGAKDSCGDLKNFVSYRRAAPDWTLLVGSGALLYAALEAGGDGGIVAVGNFVIDLAVSIAGAFDQGDKAGAGAAQEMLTPLHQEIVGKMGPAGVKAAMDLVGLDGGPVRRPLMDLGEASRSRVGELLHQAGAVPA